MSTLVGLVGGCVCHAGKCLRSHLPNGRDWGAVARVATGRRLSSLHFRHVSVDFRFQAWHENSLSVISTDRTICGYSTCVLPLSLSRSVVSVEIFLILQAGRETGLSLLVSQSRRCCSCCTAASFTTHKMYRCDAAFTLPFRPFYFSAHETLLAVYFSLTR